jgi:hypothetical protein
MDFETTYDVYANSWRISDEESLFDYSPGENTATFTDLDFPGEFVGVHDLDADERRRAEEVCRDAGVDHQPFLDNCIFDVALTGERDFAASAAWIARGFAPREYEAQDDGRPFEVAAGVQAPAIAVDADGIVHVVWVEGHTSDAVLVARSLSAGGEWSEPVTLSGEQSSPSQHFLERDPDGNVCVFWDSIEASSVLQRCYGNEAWSGSDRLGGRALGGFEPAFDTDGDPIFLAAGASCCIVFDEVTLSAESPETSGAPAMAVDSEGRLHAVFVQQSGPDDTELGMVHRMSADGGETWSQPEVFDSVGAATHEVVSDADGRVHWFSSAGTYHRWTDDHGWSNADEPNGDEGLGSARLAVDSEGLAVAVFAGDADGVYLAKQEEDGTFGSPRLVSGTSGTDHEAVVVAVGDDGTIHLVALTASDDKTLTYLAVA